MRHVFLLPFLFGLSSAIAQSPEKPVPLGGMEAVRWFLDDELTYPEAALAAGAKGEVVISFIVTGGGQVASLGVMKGLRPDLDAEALRLARLVRWTPASVGGTPTNTPQELTVPFHAKRYRKLQGRKDRCAAVRSNWPVEPGDTLHTRGLDSLATPLVDKGMRGLPQYIADHLQYPEEARRRDIQGKVTIEFVVETSGRISNLRVLEFLGAGCDEEARRLARTICWRPAVRKGHRVRSVVKLDIQFRLDHYQRP